MKTSSLFLLIGLIATTIFTSCGKSDNSASTPTTVQITVADGRNGVAASSATVSLYESMAAVNSNTPKYTQSTDQNNQVNITVDYLSQYYVVVIKGTAKNYYSGLIPTGIFQSQADISASAMQNPAGVVGGVKYQDSNGDGIINNSDKTDAPTIALKQNMNNTKTVTVY